MNTIPNMPNGDTIYAEVVEDTTTKKTTITNEDVVEGQVLQEEDKIYSFVNVRCSSITIAREILRFVREELNLTADSDRNNLTVVNIMNIKHSQLLRLKKRKATLEAAVTTLALVEKGVGIVHGSVKYAAQNMVTPAAKGVLKIAGGVAEVGATTAIAVGATAFNTAWDTGKAVCSNLAKDEEVVRLSSNISEAKNKVANFFHRLGTKEEDFVIVNENDKNTYTI